MRKFIFDGGILITEARFGLKDGNGHLYERPLMEDLFGVKYDHTEIIDKEMKIPSLNASAAGFRDIIEAEDNTIIAKFEDGHPALIEKRIGKGKVYYAAFSLFMSILKEGNQELIRLIRERIPEPEFRIINADGVEMSVLDGEKSVLYLINHSKAVQSPVIELPKKYKGAKDILNGGSYTADGSISLEMKGSEVKVLVLD